MCHREGCVESTITVMLWRVIWLCIGIAGLEFTGALASAMASICIPEVTPFLRHVRHVVIFDIESSNVFSMSFLGAHPLLWYSLEGDPFVLGTDFFSMCFLLLSASMGILETLILPFLILESGLVEEPDVSAGDHSAKNNNNNIKIVRKTLNCRFHLLFR